MRAETGLPAEQTKEEERAFLGPVARKSQVRPWTRPHLGPAFPAFPDRVGSPTDTPCIGRPGQSTAREMNRPGSGQR